MTRTITVRGTGHIRLKPDMTVVSLNIIARSREHDKAMSQAAEALAQLRDAIENAGVDSDLLKTSSFSVQTEYNGVNDRNGVYRNVFVGYICSHGVSLELDLDAALLSRVLSAIASSVAEPELNIRFTVRDRNAVSRSLLESAAANAREKAEILAAASGVKLGELVTIEYGFGELEPYSPTRFTMAKRCMANGAVPVCEDMAIAPEDIELSDSASFVWELL